MRVPATVPKRLLILTALCLGATAIFVAAPALSLQPYIPDPVDFSQPLPSAKRVGELAQSSPLRTAARQPTYAPDSSTPSGVRWISPEVTAPKTFDAVGLQGERRPVEFRTKRRDEPWTAWHEVDSGDPVWAGHSNQVQVRSRDGRPQGKLYYVNVGATDSGLHHVLSTARGAIHSAFISVIGTPLAGAANKPPFISRAAWGASKCPPRAAPEYGHVKGVVVHHTVNTNTYSASQAKGIVLAICRFHRNSNGWNDIGYNALVDRFGRIYVGRYGGTNRAVIGAHTQGFNAQMAGIASIGDHRTHPISRKAASMIARYIAWKLGKIGHLRPGGHTNLVSAGGSESKFPAGTRVHTWRTNFHSNLGKTDCPGSAGRRQIRAIRQSAQART